MGDVIELHHGHPKRWYAAGLQLHHASHRQI
jgi:hypothetical protein